MRTDLLVIGAGPYAYSAAAYAQERGIDTHVLGRPMAFWRDQMPAGMFLRSGPDWSLDAAGQDSFEAYFEHAGCLPPTSTRSPSVSSSTTPTGSPSASTSRPTSGWSPS